jgi:hypothetical protein
MALWSGCLGGRISASTGKKYSDTCLPAIEVCRFYDQSFGKRREGIPSIFRVLIFRVLIEFGAICD